MKFGHKMISAIR